MAKVWMLTMCAAAAWPSLAFPVHAQSASQTAHKVEAHFRTHCARCHDASLLEQLPVKGRLGNILDLNALAERSDLIQPGDPDASRLYQLLLGRHRPQDVFFGPLPGPSPAEIQDVRDWISTLPRTEHKGCDERKPLTREDLLRDAAGWRRLFAGDGADDLRFLSLAPLYNLCRSDERLQRYRDAAIALLAQFATTRTAPAIETVGEASVLIAFRPSEMGWTAARWDEYAGGDEHQGGIVDADRLAAQSLTGGPSVIHDTSNSETIDGLDPLAALAFEYERIVTIDRAAAESGEERAQLVSRLEALDGPALDEDLRADAIRLRQTGLPRPAWTRLKALIFGQDVLPPASDHRSAGPLELALWTDRVSYRRGDLLTIYARTTRDCHLTLIAIETDGLATVLFPNDSAPDNLIAAGRTLAVPEPEAPYQFRLNTPGRKSLVAICSVSAKRPEGIGHDFERQRFTSLGDWREFVASTSAKEAAYQEAQAQLRRFRSRRAAVLPMPHEEINLGPDEEARAGLSFTVE